MINSIKIMIFMFFYYFGDNRDIQENLNKIPRGSEFVIPKMVISLCRKEVCDEGYL